MNPVKIAITANQAEALQALYAEMHELKVRLEHAQQLAATAARASMTTAGMIIKDAGHNPDAVGNVNLEKQPDGSTVLVLHPKEQ